MADIKNRIHIGTEIERGANDSGEDKALVTVSGLNALIRIDQHHVFDDAIVIQRDGRRDSRRCSLDFDRDTRY